MKVKSRRRAKGREEFKRPAPNRQERDKVLIVTEGEKTEPDYFKRLIAELGLTTAKVRITGDGGSAPISVVQTAENILRNDDDFEQVYLVFDRDRHASYDQAIARVVGLQSRDNFLGKTVVSITSVPCFEVWYTFHISNSLKPYEAATTGDSPARALISDLKKVKLDGDEVFRDYSKSDCKDFFSKIAGQRNQAKINAQIALREATQRGDQTHHENPSTRVYLVVEALEKLSES